MIWCVDDDNTIRDIEVYTLTQTGFEAKGFSDGISMLEALKTEKPELIVLDIMMPGMDGVEVLKEIRNRTDTRKIPVIMATAKGTEMDKIQEADLIMFTGGAIFGINYLNTAQYIEMILNYAAEKRFLL